MLLVETIPYIAYKSYSEKANYIYASGSNVEVYRCTSCKLI